VMMVAGISERKIGKFARRFERGYWLWRVVVVRQCYFSPIRALSTSVTKVACSERDVSFASQPEIFSRVRLVVCLVISSSHS